jgi:hypothetical protein
MRRMSTASASMSAASVSFLVAAGKARQHLVKHVSSERHLSLVQLPRRTHPDPNTLAPRRSCSA